MRSPPQANPWRTGGADAEPAASRHRATAAPTTGKWRGVATTSSPSRSTTPPRSARERISSISVSAGVVLEKAAVSSSSPAMPLERSSTWTTASERKMGVATRT